MVFEALLARLFGQGEGLDIDELARRLGVSVERLGAVQPSYREFTIPKRSGSTRRISAPNDDLKELQQRVRKRLIHRLRAHWAATGFERRHSIVTNAVVHTGRDVVIRMDIKDFFANTSAKRVERYFRKIGWNRKAARTLTRLCTHRGGLPQGAPTSPRLSNLINFRLDARLAGLAETLGAVYTRYADDITFSLVGADSQTPRDTPVHFPQERRTRGVAPAAIRNAVSSAIVMTKRILAEEGYSLHMRRKLHIRRRHQQQLVTGLVVNERVNLPRATRRWLRAVEHHVATGRDATLTPEQLEGWRALQSMVTRT